MKNEKKLKQILIFFLMQEITESNLSNIAVQ